MKEGKPGAHCQGYSKNGVFARSFPADVGAGLFIRRRATAGIAFRAARYFDEGTHAYSVAAGKLTRAVPALLLHLQSCCGWKFTMLRWVKFCRCRQGSVLRYRAHFSAILVWKAGPVWECFSVAIATGNGEMGLEMIELEVV